MCQSWAEAWAQAPSILLLLVMAVASEHCSGAAYVMYVLVSSPHRAPRPQPCPRKRSRHAARTDVLLATEVSGNF